MSTTGFDTPIKRIGANSPAAERRQLRAGPLSLVLEDGDLRYIRLGEREIVRRIYVAIRGANWETIAPTYTGMRTQIEPDSFAISFDTENAGLGIDFSWHGTIRGKADGTITFTMDGEARRAFRKNRIGFCILHPMACAGVPCTLRHSDGTSERSAFPEAISPHQPFLDIVAITHDVAPGLRAEVEMSGDVFEMEDQRNWTDASFKTYGTPLHIPYPVEVQAGTRFTQSVTLRLHGAVARSGAEVLDAQDAPVTLRLAQSSAGRLPRLGLALASHGRALSDRELGRLRRLRLDHLRVDLDLSSATYADSLRRATHEAVGLDAALEIALFLSDKADRELADLVELLRREQPPVARWLVFHHNEKATSARWLRLARRHLVDYGHDIPLAGGSNAYFTELNRSRPDIDAPDMVCYSINPQVHAFDNASMVETLAAQAATIESARRFCDGRPLAVTPVTLKMRFNPDATGPVPEPAPGELPPQVDARQLSLFGAAWTLGSIKHLSESGTASVTYYQTTGWRGVMETEAGSALPARFPSLPGMLFPLYHVLADCCEFAHAEVFSAVSSDPLKVEGLALRDGPRHRILVANLTNDRCSVDLAGIPAEMVSIRRLDEHTFDRAVLDGEAFRGDPLELRLLEHGVLSIELLPYAVVRLDYTAGAASS